MASKQMIYGAEAARTDLRLPRTLALVMLNRAPRIGISGLSAALAGALARRRGPGSGTVAAAYLIGWVVFYGWYWRFRNDPGIASA